MDKLRLLLQRIDGRSYPAYKEARGTWRFEDYALDIVHVQGDPFAAPSAIAARVPLDYTSISDADLRHPHRRVGVEDALLRSFARAARAIGGGGRGSGKSGHWGVVRVGQEMVARTGCEVRDGELCLRFTAGLPAQGRRVLGWQAEAMFFKELPRIIEEGILGVDLDRVRAYADGYEDQEALRAQLSARGWVGFIANGAILPRRSGVDERPMEPLLALPWRSPEALEAEVELPHAGRVRGTAIPAGVTLICGGGYHGKSTVLRALTRAVYNHIPGDGRELCSAVFDAVHIRAEDGRRICAVDISPFIGNLPDGRDTARFSSDNASGSTSQAANIVEALELGATCLLIDEDTSATNFMVRDRRMQALIQTDREPITPFVDRARALADDHGVSTVLVVGGSGDCFEIADTVLVMDAYTPRLATDEARQIAARFPSGRLEEARGALQMPAPRVPLAEGFDPSSGRKAQRVRTRDTRTISFGEEEIEVSLLAQLIDEGQTRAIGDWLLACARRLADGRRSLVEICDAMEREVAERGLSATALPGAGDRVLVRRYEFAAAINRLRSLSIR